MVTDMDMGTNTAEGRMIILNEELIQKIVEIARHAGTAILEVYNYGNAGETKKEDDSPLTLADLASHQIIVKELAEISPVLPILSEEAANIPFADRKLWKQYWLIDPLDGTKEFIKRNGEFTVNIALIEDGVPVMGVVYAPVLDVCYYGSRNNGAFVMRGNNAVQPLAAKPYVEGEPIKVVASRSHSDARTDALLKQLGVCQCISMGSSLKLCLVADGTANLYPRLGPTMEWDTAAAHAVVNAAGGRVCDMKGVDLIYNKPDLHNPEFLVLLCHDMIMLKLLGIPIL